MSDVTRIQIAHNRMICELLKLAPMVIEDKFVSLALNEERMRQSIAAIEGQTRRFTREATALLDVIKEVFPDKAANHPGIVDIWPQLLANSVLPMFELTELVNGIGDFLWECWASSVYA